MSKTFLNIHVLISHSPSCLNRDDMNMQKSAIFGGKRRVRISSQSLKRAIRTSDYYRAHIGEPSIRTRELHELKDKALIALSNEFEENVIITAIEWIVGKVDKKEFKLDKFKKGQIAVAPWQLSEVTAVCNEIVKGRKTGDDDKTLKRNLKNHIKGIQDALDQAADVALSGRMATTGLRTTVDGAMAVAHAFTTHPVDADIDWFTAVDDLVVDEDETGAGHLNTQEFSSGVFYRYASLNIPQLQNNLGNCGRDRALEIAGHLVHMLATVVPSAKQQAFAAHNVADTVLLCLSDLPISLANAFETPVSADRDGGFRMPSTRKLIEHHQALQIAYKLEQDSGLFSILDADAGNMKTFDGLLGWLQNDGSSNE